MMRITSVAIVAIVLILAGCDTSGRIDPVYQNYFIKYYGADGNQQGKDLYVNDDGTMILLGNSSSLTEVSMPFIVKTDSLGNVLWQRQLGGQNEAAQDVELISGGVHQGRFVVVSNIGDAGSYSVRVTIVDQDGKSIDSLILPNTGMQFAKSVTMASNNEFLISGFQEPSPEANKEPIQVVDDEADLMLLRVSQSPLAVTRNIRIGGEKNGWISKTFEVTLQDTVKYAMFGYSDRPVSASSVYEAKFELIVVNVIGNPSLRRTSGATGDATLSAQVVKVPAFQGGGFLMVGTAENGGSGDIFFTKYSNDFSEPNPAPAMKLPEGRKVEGVAVAAAVAEDGYFFLADEEQDNNSTNNNILLMHVRRDGSKIWSTSFGSEEGNDQAGAMAALRGGRIAVLGTIDLETQRKMALIIVTKTGGFSN